MTLEEIFYFSQSVASLAVVGSLIYLGLQVRSAERSQRAMMQQGRADRAAHGAMAIANPDLARVFQKGAAGDPTLTREEFTQWMMICRALFLSGEDSFLRITSGSSIGAHSTATLQGSASIWHQPGCAPRGSCRPDSSVTNSATSLTLCWPRPP